MHKRTHTAVPADQPATPRQRFDQREFEDGLRRCSGPVAVWALLVVCLAMAGWITSEQPPAWAHASPAVDAASSPRP